VTTDNHLWGSVIFIDDEEDVRLSGQQTLEIEGFETTALDRAETALDHVTAAWPGVVVTDVKMPGMGGMELLDRITRIDPDLPVVLITGHGDIPLAVDAMRTGAYDFIEKPADPEYLIDVVRRALEKRRLIIENRALRLKLDAAGEMEQRIIGATQIMDKLRITVADLANTEVDILIVGETGTGKELVARCLHDFGSRREGRFVALNCGALPESTIESELFGHEAGAFTSANKRRIGKIEYAEGGTLFLDEIESMPPAVQVRLLRVLQERTIERLGGNDPIPVDIRVIAASKLDLRNVASDGNFREDLYYRLHVASVAIPALRERAADIPFLFEQFAATAGARFRRSVPEINVEKMNELSARPWPGNVRELKNAAERFVLGMSASQADGTATLQTNDSTLSLSSLVAAFERKTIIAALRENAGRVGKTAEALRLPRKTLYLRMQKHGLERDDFC
jgi:two-component system, NtrC family, C4-dicarboxylate transport response regulator DctD